jgi:chromodomain-helicase-DNA-binding protein 1
LFLFCLTSFFFFHQGLFAAFKVADFSAITRDDTASAAAAAAEQRRKAAAAHEAALAAVQKREAEDKELADDTGFWARLIPESERQVDEPEEKEDAAANAFGIVPARKAARAVQNLNENRLAQSRISSSSSTANAAAKQAAAAAAAAAAEKALSREDRVARETLSARDVRVLLRGIMRFGFDEENPPRLEDIIVQGKLQNKDRQTVLQAGVAVLRMARKVVADPPSAPPPDEANASTAATTEAAKKTPKFDPMRFDFRGESVNAQQLVARIDGLAELRKRLVALGDNARSFRLPVTVKAPQNGWEVGWSPADDAMLLIGVFKYGVGAWQQIRDEPQLRLTGKIQQNASAAAADAAEGDGAAAAAPTKETAESADPSKPGAAASHLSRRVDTLLRELCRAASASNGTTTAAASSSSTAATSGGAKAPPKRKAPLPGGSAAAAKSDSSQPKSKSAKTAAKKSASSASLIGEPIVSLNDNEVDNELYERARGYMSAVKEQLKKMAALPSRSDLGADEKRQRTKTYMLAVGAHIETVVEEKRAGGAFSVARLQLLRRHMWFYAAKYTTTDSAKLEAAYRMLQVVAQKAAKQ